MDIIILIYDAYVFMNMNNNVYDRRNVLAMEEISLNNQMGKTQKDPRVMVSKIFLI